MSMKVVDVDSLAARLDDATLQAHRVPMLSASGETFSEDEAYRIQRAGVARRESRGERLVGMKMGLTSRAKIKQMGVAMPIYGHLTDAMVVADGGSLSLARLSHPRVEPEVAFILGRDLQGAVTPQQAWEAVAWVCPALEILDSRYENFKFNLVDVIADNASSSHFVVGTGVPARDGVPLECAGLVMEIDGAVVQTGSTAAVYDHPVRSLMLQAAMLARHGGALRAGQVVLTGGATEAVPLSPGRWVRVTVEGLGEASFRTTE